MKIETRCKFCVREIEMDVDQVGFENPAINAKLWLKNVACNRCAGYYSEKSRLANKIGSVCQVLTMAKNTDKENKVAEAVRIKLEALTKKLCAVICDFKFAQFTWDIEFVNMLMERPEFSGKTINLYTHRLNKILTPG